MKRTSETVSKALILIHDVFPATRSEKDLGEFFFRVTSAPPSVFKDREYDQAKFRDDLTAALKLPYFKPKKQGEKEKKKQILAPTLNERLERIGLADAFLSADSIASIREWMDFLLVAKEEEAARKAVVKNSQYGYPTQFHESALGLLLRQHKKYRELSERFNVPKSTWTRSFEEAIAVQIASEIRAIFPDYPLPAMKESVRFYQVQIYEEISKRLRPNKKRGLEQLCLELTAIICSLPEYLTNPERRLSPTSIRTARRYEKKLWEN
jgi:hypothetical protein